MLAAGCLEGGPQAKDEQSAVRAGRVPGPGGSLPAVEFGERVMIYDKDGLTPLDLPELPTPVTVSMETIRLAGSENGIGCGEPTGGVTSQKPYIFQVCLANVYRSDDHGATWAEVSTTASSPTTLDPYMWVDPLTDRVYSVQLYVACSYLSYSDDYGATWITNPVACGLPVNDHQTFSTGPSALPIPMVAYENMAYYCVNQLADTMCARSFDGGLTWTGTVAQLTARDIETGSQCSAINGHVHVGPDGTAYLPKRMCTLPHVLTSTDNGLTWTARVISRAHPVVQSLAHDPTVTTDAEGNAYYFWTADDGILRMSVSKDAGATWSAPVRASPPGMTMSLFETSVGGDPGRVSVAYYGTYQPREPDDEKKRWRYSSQAPNETVWHLFLTTTTNALDEEPLFTTIQVNPTDDPIQRGCVWLQGGGSACRNLLDFFDMTAGPDGRPYIHYADGCVNKCLTWTQESEEPIPRSSWGTVGVVQTGPSLKADVDWLEPLPRGVKIT